METPPETDLNLAGAAKRAAWRVLAICHNRAELLMVEVQEERERARTVIFLGAAFAVLGLLAGITVTGLIVCAAGNYKLIALAVLSIIYIAGAAFFYFKLARLQENWESFAGTREQLEKDRECFEEALS